MRKFHSATIVEKAPETEDSVRLKLAVPEDAANEFRYHQGQHLPVRAAIDGKNLRRTYSICSSVGDDELTLGIRVQPDGRFSNFVAEALEVGDELEIMPPSGHFYTELDPAQAKSYAAFVAGSGITPILSIVKTTLETEPESRFVVFYGNRRRATTMFLETLWALKNRYRERLSLHFILSREPGELDIYTGRIDTAKTKALYEAFLRHDTPDEIFVCGPDTMIDGVKEGLAELDFPAEHVHMERFRPVQKGAAAKRPAPSQRRTVERGEGDVEVSVVMDGHRQRFRMPSEGMTVLEAGEAAGLDLPYSCRGGVCSTCRTRLVEGEVEMAVNYALEPWELEQGYILACQATPQSEALELDYDQT